MSANGSQTGMMKVIIYHHHIQILQVQQPVPSARYVAAHTPKINNKFLFILASNIYPILQDLVEASAARKTLNPVLTTSKKINNLKNSAATYKTSSENWDKLALTRSFYQLGIRGVERVQYWKLFFWSLFRRPHLYSMARTQAFYGFHIRQMVTPRYITRFDNIGANSNNLLLFGGDYY